MYNILSNVDISSLLTSIDIHYGTFPGIQRDVSLNMFYLDDNTSTSNISRELLNTLITAAPSRFVDISNNWNYNEVQDGFYKMPIMAGDSIAFKLTITPALSQRLDVHTSQTPLNPRKYTIKLIVS